MKLSQKEETTALQVYKTYFDSYTGGDVEKIESLLLENYTQIGSAEAEVFFDKKEALNFLHDTIDQVAGKAEIRNRVLKVEPLDGYILIIDLFDMYVISEDKWMFYAKLRASTLMEKKETGWKFVYQHSSMPDTRALDGDNIAIEKISAENQQLREAVKRRTIELESKNRDLAIETALEKVRAKSMAMHQSDELGEVAVLLYKELNTLGFSSFFNCGYVEVEVENGIQQTWMTSPEGKEMRGAKLPLTGDSVMNERFKAWKKQNVLFHQKVTGNKLQKHMNFVQPYYGSKEMDSMVRAKFPETVFFYCANFTQGYLHVLSETQLSQEEEALLIRFTQVFKMSYNRFLDLQKAERQTREALIEAALERIRASALAMRSSKELIDVAQIMREQMGLLGQPELEASVIHLYPQNSETFESWYAMRIAGKKEGKIIKGVAHYRIKSSAVAREMINAYNKSPTEYTLQFKGAKLKEWMKEVLAQAPEVGKLISKKPPNQHFYHFSNFSGGSLMMVSLDEPSEEAKSLQRRAAAVFGFAYTRFLDLQKAEAQAREAQIETALEKVRSRSLAMHKSEELADTASMLFEQLHALGELPDRVGICIINEEQKVFELWVTNQKGKYLGHQINASIEESTTMAKLYKAWKGKKDHLIIDLQGHELKKWMKFVREDSKMLVDDTKIKGRRIHNSVFFSNGMFICTTHEPVSNEIVKLLIRFVKVFEQAYTRFLDLQKAEEQAQEAQIEVALERIRAASLAMHESNELLNVIKVISNQLEKLAIQFNHVSFGQNNALEDYKFWTSIRGLEEPFMVHIPYINHPMIERLKKARKDKVSLFADSLTIKQHSRWNEHMFKYQAFSMLSNEQKEKLLNLPFDRSIAILPNIFLVIANYRGEPYSEKENKIIARVGKVFEQAYTRFLDLQNVEAQAREAQIEAALERVRSKTMAMHDSDDVGVTVLTLFDEVLKLGLDNDIRCGIGILEGTERMETRSATLSPNGEVDLKIGMLDMTIHPLLKRIKKAWKSRGTRFIDQMTGKDVIRYYTALNNEPDYPFFVELDTLPEKEFHNSFSFSEGILFSFSPNPMSEEAAKVLSRFASVFGQTYRRYLDLINAEALAREAQIEAALERVRSRSMAMHKTDELWDVINVVAKQYELLEIKLDTCFINIFEENSNDMNIWIAADGQTYPERVRIPFIKTPAITRQSEARENGETFFTQDLSLKFKDQFFNHFFKNATNIKVPKKRRNLIAKGGGFTGSVAVSPHASITIANYRGIPYSDEENEIFKRIGKVFEQTYTRFLDLQKAELQTREAQIETALERVRARALAMQDPDELREVAQVLRHEMGALGVEELETCSIYINDVQAEKAECWYALKDVRNKKKNMVSGYFALDLNDTWVGRKMLQFYNAKESQTSIVMKGANRIEWIRYCEEKSAPFRGYYGDVIPNRTYQLYKFSHGAIGAATPGDISEENWGLLKRAASVFSLAYSRFKDLSQALLDLKKLKEAKQKAENALTELKSTQSQLVHAEKMASLGELTAGIAHEIQNPLNFVNNFSEVSGELVEEINEEIQAGNLDEVEYITTDLKQNLDKINHHGQRASGIVKGMLEHSRTGSGEKEFTDINKLADEYLRLSYHGLRAKDKSFNADFKSEFDEKMPKVKIVAQDLGRVILNLINNAFYAVSEKAGDTEDGNYKPTVIVSTKKLNGKVEIIVKDNGDGIPADVVEKIYQPFFTTKPTGSGTGLGLSMSYDIITKGHGGELKVKSVEGKETKFIINLPI